MYLFHNELQASTVKTSGNYYIFETVESILRVNIGKITTENRFNGNHFGLKVTINQITAKKLYFWYSTKLVTCALCISTFHK